MDYNSNTLLCTTLRKENARSCSNCKCTCLVEYCNKYSWNDVNESKYTTSFDTFYDFLTTNEFTQSKHYEPKENLFRCGISDKAWFRPCYCKICQTGEYCKSVARDLFNQTLDINKINCLKCGYKNHKNKFTKCHCTPPGHVWFLIVWIPEAPIKHTPEDAIYTLTFFKLTHAEYEASGVESLDFFDTVDWFLNNQPIFTQFSIFSSINIYDDQLKQQFELCSFFFDYDKDSYQKYIKHGQNQYFSGLKSDKAYSNAFYDLVRKYMSKEALEALPPKKNPHMDKPKITPKRHV